MVYSYHVDHFGFSCKSEMHFLSTEGLYNSIIIESLLTCLKEMMSWFNWPWVDPKCSLQSHFLLQMDCNYPVSSPWNAVCSHRLHFWCWYVQYRHNTRGVSLWGRSFCWWWIETAKRSRVGTCRASGEIHGCYSQEASLLYCSELLQLFRKKLIALCICSLFYSCLYINRLYKLMNLSRIWCAFNGY